jgi:Zn-dependent protease
MGAVALDVSAAIAWWMVKKGRPYGRTWALVASTSALVPSSLFLIRQPGHYPFAIFMGGFLGLAGLVAFAARDSAIDVADARLRKKARIAGDGTSKFKDYVAQGVSMGIIWVAFQLWNQWAVGHGLARPGLISYLAQLNFAVLLTTFFHELGHLAAGLSCGKILRVFQVGPLRWAVRNGKWGFEFRLRKFYGGGVAMVAPDLLKMRSRQALLLTGGPVASLVVGLIFVVVTLTAVGHAWQPFWSLLSTLATLSIAAFVVNLIPLQPESQYSDGAQIYQILTNGPWARVHLAFAMVTTSVVAPIRPRDFDMNVINQAIDFLRHGERGLLLRLVACKHYIDKNRIPEALAYMQEAEELFGECKFEKPQDICAEFVYVNAFHKRDLAAADLWWQRIEALRKIDPDADYWRARTALLWLQGEREAALATWEHGNELAQKLASVGTYDFTRSCFTKLRKVLDAPNPPLPAVAFKRPEMRLPVRV